MGMNFTNLRILFLLLAVALGMLFMCKPQIDGEMLVGEVGGVPAPIRRLLTESEGAASWSVRGEWLCVVGLLLVVSLVVVLLSRMLYIAYFRRQMRRYANFLRDSYADRPVDPLLYRKWSETVEAYNQSRSHWPFRLFWRAAETGIFQQREGPPRVAGLAGTGVSDDMGKRKPCGKNKKR